MVTISTHVGHVLSEEHNLRDEKRTSKDGHIDPSKTPLNETIYYEPIKSAYHTLFDDSVAEYNAKQTRDNRRIDDYYKKICESKQKFPAYEMIIGVYNKTDKGKVIEPEREVSDADAKDIMIDFVKGWQVRNPNLYLTGAHYHADEDGQAHIHIDFIPFADDFTRGMKRQTAFDKALQKQGYTKTEAEYEIDENGKEVQKKAWSTPQMKWEAAENKALEDLCRAKGLTVEHPDREAGGRRHEQTADYKQSKDELREIKAEISQQQEIIKSDYEPLRQDILRKINEEAQTKEEEFSRTNSSQVKLISSQISDISKFEAEITQLTLQKTSLAGEIKTQQKNLDLIKELIPVYDTTIKDLKAADLIQPKKAFIGNNLVISPDDWNKWQKFYKNTLSGFSSACKVVKDLTLDNQNLKNDIEQKDSQIKDLQISNQENIKKINALEADIAKKDKKISLLEKAKNRIKSGLSIALKWFNISAPASCVPKLLDVSEDFAKRSEIPEIQIGDKFADCTITVMQDTIGNFGLLQEKATGRKVLLNDNDLLSATNGFEGNTVKGNKVEFDGFELTKNNTFERYPKTVSEYERIEKHSGGGGMRMSSRLKEKLLELERQRTVS